MTNLYTQPKKKEKLANSEMQQWIYLARKILEFEEEKWK